MIAICKYKFFAFTKAGSSHQCNEDRILIGGQLLSSGAASGECAEQIMAVVCDGVGGEPHGGLAASIAAASFRNISDNILSPYTIAEITLGANESIRKWQRKNDEYKKMSTTIAGISLVGKSFLAFNAGDTRVYMYCGGELRQISTDHTKICRKYLREVGEEKGERAEQSVVTRFLGGTGNSWFPSLNQGRIEESAVLFILCTDGIYKKLENSDFLCILSCDMSTEEKCQAIMNKAVHNGSTDDMSITVLEILNS